MYVGLKDKDGRQFEDKGNCRLAFGAQEQFLRPGCGLQVAQRAGGEDGSLVKSSGPQLRPCYYHPHKMSQIKDVAKTHHCFCSKDMALKCS